MFIPLGAPLATHFICSYSLFPFYSILLCYQLTLLFLCTSVCLFGSVSFHPSKFLNVLHLPLFIISSLSFHCFPSIDRFSLLYLRFLTLYFSHLSFSHFPPSPLLSCSFLSFPFPPFHFSSLLFPSLFHLTLQFISRQHIPFAPSFPFASLISSPSLHLHFIIFPSLL